MITQLPRFRNKDIREFGPYGEAYMPEMHKCDSQGAYETKAEKWNRYLKVLQAYCEEHGLSRNVGEAVMRDQFAELLKKQNDAVTDVWK